jgi:hypothetical protein
MMKRLFVLLLLSFFKIEAYEWETHRTLGEASRTFLFEESSNRIRSNDRVLFLGIDCLPDQFSSNAKEHLFGYNHLQEKRSFDLICAFHPYITELKKIEKALKPGGMCIILYLPLESYHWRVINSIQELGSLSPNVSAHDYDEEIEDLGFVFLEKSFGRDIALYTNSNEFISDVHKNLKVWGMRYTYQGAVEKFVDSMYSSSKCFSKDGKAIRIPYHTMSYVLLKPSDSLPTQTMIPQDE